MLLKLGCQITQEREGRERPESRKDTGGLNCLLSKGCQFGRLMQTALKLPCNRSSKIELYRLWEGQFLCPKKNRTATADLLLGLFACFSGDLKLLPLSMAEVELRTQASRPRPRPRTQKKSEAKAKDSLSEDRHSRGQGQECSRPRTKDTKRKCSPPKKKGVHKNFSGDLKILTFQKIVLSSSRGQANFRGLEASRPRI